MTRPSVVWLVDVPRGWGRSAMFLGADGELYAERCPVCEFSSEDAAQRARESLTEWQFVRATVRPAAPLSRGGRGL